MKKISVYDTISKKYVEIEVGDEIYTYYMRTGWNIKDNDESFFSHEIQFSVLKGNHDNAFENFREFVNKDDPEKETEKRIMTEQLYRCLDFLSSDERKLIEMIYFDNKTEREFAAYYGINQKNIHKKKALILCKINKLLNK